MPHQDVMREDGRPVDEEAFREAAEIEIDRYGWKAFLFARDGVSRELHNDFVGGRIQKLHTRTKDGRQIAVATYVSGRVVTFDMPGSPPDQVEIANRYWYGLRGVARKSGMHFNYRELFTVAVKAKHPEFTHKQVAAMVGMPESQVDTYLRRADEKYQAALRVIATYEAVAIRPASPPVDLSG